MRLANAGVAQIDSPAAQRLASALTRLHRPAAGAGGNAAPREGGAPTGRETEVLRLVARGATNREIARSLYLSEGTVENHVSRILGRPGPRDRTHAAVHARDHGLI